jgi:hypothetical protein
MTIHNCFVPSREDLEPTIAALLCPQGLRSAMTRQSLPFRA